jgi:hypothetical protein
MLWGIEHSRVWRVAVAGLVLSALGVPSALSGRAEPTIDELKARVASASIADRPALCVRIAERQVDAAGRLYVAGDSEKGQAALADVVAYCESARNYAIQSHKHEKQSEIAMRKMVRKLVDLEHTISHEEQQQVQNAVDRLEHIRNDLLADMFPKVGKK